MLQKEFITTTQAGELLGFSRTHIIRLIKSGEIKARKIEGDYLIDKNSIGVLRNITPRELDMARSSSEMAIKKYGDVIRKLGAE